jgi:hypothetical protein
MLRTRPLCPHEACLISVSALDALVTDLVRAQPLRVSSAFLDWVADEATPLVEQQVHDCFAHPRFAASLRQGDHRLALFRWVRHWVHPHISQRFSELTQHLPQFQAMPSLAPLPEDRQLPALPANTAIPVLPALPLAARPVPRGALGLPALA